ncbi:MAG: condensin subunit MukF [Planctomycetota bacterium]|nr:condensin subunit MukF [Planctomycetota bacterium]
MGRALASIERGRVSLSLDTTDLCFLVALRARAERAGLASFEEDLLVEIFEERLEQSEPGAANPRKRATHAIQRLRDQRLLARVDAAGVVQAGEFALTRLAVGIVDFFLAEETLTRESLGLLTKMLREQLVECRGAARKAGRDEAAWAARVTQPLRVLVADLLTGIERRQRGMDAQQEEVVAEIERLLRDDWFEAVAACETLLESTSSTLRELHDVLLQDTTHLSLLLQELEGLATKARNAAALEAIRSAAEHVERVGAWGGARLRTWSGYYQHVHGFLRDVVRLDPERAVSQRLRDQLARFVERPFALFVAAEPSIRLLREEARAVARPAVARPRQDRGLSFEEVNLDDDPGERLEARVRAALEGGAASLSQVLARVLPGVPDAERYRTVGRVAALLAAEADLRVEAARVRPWIPVSQVSVSQVGVPQVGVSSGPSVPDAVEVEEWDLRAPASTGARRARLQPSEGAT